MTYLLDTHTFMWAVMEDPRLSARAKAIIENSEIDVYVSLVSIWEIAIKVGIGKLKLTQPVEEFVLAQLAKSRFEVLHPTLKDVLNVANLPLHHRDPFDRLLISQSFVQGMPLISVDDKFDAYGVERVWKCRLN